MSRWIRLVALTVAVLAPVSRPAADEPAAASDEARIAAASRAFCIAYVSGDLEKLGGLYTADAVAASRSYRARSRRDSAVSHIGTEPQAGGARNGFV